MGAKKRPSKRRTPAPTKPRPDGADESVAQVAARLKAEGMVNRPRKDDA